MLRYWFPSDGKGDGRQRLDGLPGPGQEPGGRPRFSTICWTKVAAENFGTPVPAAARSSARTSWSPTARARQPRHRGGAGKVVRDGLPAAPAPAVADAAWHQVWQEFKAGG